MLANKERIGVRWILTGVSAIAVSAAVPPAAAQDEDEGTKVLDAIVVTAQKRAQDVQDVPLAITAFSSESLRLKGIDSPESLQISTPALTVGENLAGAGAQVTIRGIGAEALPPGGDPGVPLHINGHYTQSSAYVLRDFLDVERVEVLRGPQGTLYGRNAIGGNINIITKRPTEEVEGMVSIALGNYEKRLAQAVLSGPLTDSLRGRLAISDEVRDGYVEDVGLDTDRAISDYTSVRGSLEFDVTESIEVFGSAYYFDDKGNSLFVDALTTDPENPFLVSHNSPTETLDTAFGGSIDVTIDLGAMEIVSLSAFDESERDAVLDLDGTDTIRSHGAWFNAFKTFSQELRLVSTGDQKLDWVLGAFYYNESSDLAIDGLLDIPIFSSLPGMPRTRLLAQYNVKSESLAAFAHLVYDLSDQFELVGGLRYSYDKKIYDFFGQNLTPEGLTAPVIPAIPVDLKEDTWDQLTWRLGVNYHISDDHMLYVSWSRGYKAGGFSIDGRVQGGFDPESVLAYEGGLKSVLFGGRMSVNLAGFYYDYSDKQDFQNIPNPTLPGATIFALTNAAAATVAGAELEVQANVTQGFSIDASVSHTDAKYGEYFAQDAAFPALGVQDLSGNRIPRAPKWKVYIGAQNTWDLGRLGSLLLRGDLSWVGDQWANAFNRPLGTFTFPYSDLLPSYHLVNARLEWSNFSESWRIEVFVQNLSNEIVLENTSLSSLGGNAVFMPPRMWGAKLTHNF